MACHCLGGLLGGRDGTCFWSFLFLRHSSLYYVIPSLSYSCTSASQHPHQSQMIPRRHHFKPAPQPTVQVLQPPDEDAPSLTITMLGAGQEVGRSCCVIEHRGKKIVCDAGLHPAQPGIGALPFIDELDWSTVDALLITQ